MAKRIYSTAIETASDAGFQAWTTELYNELVAAGLVQTSDTGQLNVPVSASVPGNNTAAGYWVFRFDDALQGSAPIYLKIEVGLATNNQRPGIWVTVGTGSNGSGTITGTVVSRRAIVNSTENLASTSTPYPTYINHEEGFFGFCFKIGSASGGRAWLFVCRTVDDLGAPTADGYAVFAQNVTASDGFAAFGKWGGYSASDTAKAWTSVPGVLSSSAVGSDYQAFKVYGAFPEVRIVPQLVVVLNSELSLGNLTGGVEIMDGVTMEYISLSGGANGCCISHSSRYTFAMLWSP